MFHVEREWKTTDCGMVSRETVEGIGAGAAGIEGSDWPLANRCERNRIAIAMLYPIDHLPWNASGE